MEMTAVYESYWHFAAERLRMYMRRLNHPDGPWTVDPVLRAHRFTNSYRVLDRVSQYLIREVQYRTDRSQSPAEVFFRTMMFKIFNKIETWELLENILGPLSWQSFDASAASRVLTDAMRRGQRIYSAAYIMPAPPFGKKFKHDNHLALLLAMMSDGLLGQIEKAQSLEEVYVALRNVPGFGSFLAFQYSIDLNYSSLIAFEEADFVVAGPGALDGISKCFTSTDGLTAEELIYLMVNIQEREFTRLGIDFPGLFGRRLQPIDCQNLFCEISKYARVAHPDATGISGRTRIKQSYHAGDPLDQPVFPPRWGLTPPIVKPHAPRQGSLL
jgi:hypothetical protein